MAKRKTQKAQKKVVPILEKMQNRIGGLTPEMVFFNHDPAAFIEAILNSDPEKVAEEILARNTGVTPEYLAIMRAKPEEPLSFIFDDGNEVSFPGMLTYKEALQYAREMREVIERALEERLKKTAPAQYPLSLAIINGLTGTAPKEVKCIDENKLKNPAHLKLEHIFLTLLNETSAQRDHKEQGYLTGNLGAELVPLEKGIMYESAGVEVELKEVFKRWKGGDKLGGGDKKYIAKTIKEYRELIFTWQFKADMNDGKELRLEHQAPRIGVTIYSLIDKQEGGREAGGELITQAGAKIILRFHPAFLAFKAGDTYANTPANLSEIIEAAAGGGRKVTAAHWLLFHYLNSIRSTMRGGEVVKTAIGRLELMAKIGLDKYLHGRNESKGEDALRSVIGDIQKTGLLNSHTTRRGKSDTVFCFEIKKDPVFQSSAKKR